MRSIIIGLTAIAAALVPAAAAGQASRQAAPSASPQAMVRGLNIPYQTFTLDNGLRVVVHEDRKAPVVALSAWYNVGSKDEPEGQTGFAHLFEHLMLFNGTENLRGGLMEPLRAMGATDWNGTTNFDRTNYFQTVPTAALEQALYMESDRMGHLLGAVTQERLDNQRGVVQNEKRQGDNQPYGLVFYRILEGLFPQGHPYRHSVVGSMADLDAASLDTVRNWFRNNYGPNNAVLVLAGDIDMPTARRLVQRYFGHIARGPVNEPAQAAVPTLAEPLSVKMTDRVANTRLYRLWAIPGRLDPQAIPLSIAAEVLGGLASSRLDNALVRGEESAVSVTGFAQPFHRVGIFGVTVDVKPGGDADAVGRRLDAIMADFIAKGPTQDEVRRVVLRQIAERVRGLEQVGGFSGKAVALAEGMLYANDPGRYQRELQAYAAATPSQVTAAMQRWLTRPVYSIRVDPGEREAYQEAAGPARTAAQAPAAAAEAPKPREPMPPVGTVAKLDFPDIQRATLSNGISVTYVRRPQVPAMRVALEFDAGTAADPAERLGTQSLMLNLLSEGTTTRNSLQIAEEQERLGASITTGASLDRTVVNLSALTPNLAPSLDLMADVVMNPAFAPSEVERMRAQQLAAIASEQTQPAGIARRALPGLLYGASHPYGRPFSGLGDTAAIKAVTREELSRFHQSWLRPDNARIYAVGDLPLAQLVPLLEARFGRWRAPAVPRGTKAFGAAPNPGGTRIVLIDRPQSPQSYILAGTVLPMRGSDDLVPVTAANEILSGDFLARINQDIRETKGWSYGAFGNVQAVENYLPLIVQAPVQTNQTGPSVRAIIDQIRSFTGDKGITPAELQRVIAGNTRQLAGSFENSAQLLNALRSMALLKRPDDFYETVGTRFQAMTTATLDEAARKAIDPSKLVFVVVGDASVVRPQLDALGLPVEVMPMR